MGRTTDDLLNEDPKVASQAIKINLFSVSENSNEDRLPYLETFLKFAISELNKSLSENSRQWFDLIF